MKISCSIIIALLCISKLQAQTNIDTVTISNQVWMTKNLDVSTYRNGDSIPEVADPAEWAHLITGAWCNYNNDTTSGNVYGKLYNWYAINDPRGLAPFGWHVASQNEWMTLINYLGGDNIAGGKLKETGLAHWDSPNGGASDFYGFAGLPGGFRDSTGRFVTIGKNGSWWSATQTNAYRAMQRTLVYFMGFTFGYDADKHSGFSVRCIKE